MFWGKLGVKSVFFYFEVEVFVVLVFGFGGLFRVDIILRFVFLCDFDFWVYSL